MILIEMELLFKLSDKRKESLMRYFYVKKCDGASGPELCG
jgi:hypothetical protein